MEHLINMCVHLKHQLMMTDCSEVYIHYLKTFKDINSASCFITGIVYHLYVFKNTYNRAINEVYVTYNEKEFFYT